MYKRNKKNYIKYNSKPITYVIFIFFIFHVFYVVFMFYCLMFYVLLFNSIVCIICYMS